MKHERFIIEGALDPSGRDPVDWSERPKIGLDVSSRKREIISPFPVNMRDEPRTLENPLVTDKHGFARTINSPYERKWETPGYFRWLPIVTASLDQYRADLAKAVGDSLEDFRVAEALSYSAIHGGGKRIRGVLVLMVCELLNGKWDGYEKLSLLPELPHRGSLIEDDLDDHATSRDGKLCIHHAFTDGEELARLAAARLYRAPLNILSESSWSGIDSAELGREYLRLSEIARKGQALDVAWSGATKTVPTEEEYLEMCRMKCAAFEYAIYVGAMLGQANPRQLTALRAAGQKASTAFQLRDDLLALMPENEDFGSDLAERKKTLPIIRALSGDEISRNEVFGALAKPELDRSDYLKILGILEETGAISYTQTVAEQLVVESLEILEDENLLDSATGRELGDIFRYGVTRLQ